MPSLPSFRSQLLSIRARDSSERSTSSTFSVNNASGSKANNKDIRKPCGVNFQLESNSIHDVTARSELSRDERLQLWYTEEDLKVIRSDIREVKKVIKSGLRFEEDDNIEDDHLICLRGIELDREKDARLERQAKVMMELFWCESRHYFETDVASKLREITQQATEEAIIRGKKDRIAALKVYRRSR